MSLKVSVHHFMGSIPSKLSPYSLSWNAQVEVLPLVGVSPFIENRCYYHEFSFFWTQPEMRFPASMPVFDWPWSSTPLQSSSSIGISLWLLFSYFLSCSLYKTFSRIFWCQSIVGSLGNFLLDVFGFVSPVSLESSKASLRIWPTWCLSSILKMFLYI